MRGVGSDRVSGLMQKLGLEEGEAIENKLVSRAVESAQKRVEAHHFEIRKTLLDYDNVMNQQREVIYTLRRDFMQMEDLTPVLEEFAADVLDDTYNALRVGESPSEEDVAAARARLRDVFTLDRVYPADGPLPAREEAEELVRTIFAELKAEAGEIYMDVLRYFLLEELDRCWKEHLRNMDALRDGIGLRGYGQKDPKLEYKREGFEMFQAMLFRIRESVCRALTRVHVQRQEEPEADGVQEQEAQPQPELELRHRDDTRGAAYVSGGQAETPPQPKVGRNDLCPCGSGLKYKKCCGRGK